MSQNTKTIQAQRWKVRKYKYFRNEELEVHFNMQKCLYFVTEEAKYKYFVPALK